MKGESDFEAAQLLVLAAQDALHTVVTVSQPGGQIHVGQVEVRLRQRVRALRGQRAGKERQQRSEAFWVVWEGYVAPANVYINYSL